jgi:hypothetical protein
MVQIRKEDSMNRPTLIFGTLILLAAPSGAVDPVGYEDLRAAQVHLQVAGDYLRAIPDDAAGRRDRAIEFVNNALGEVYSLMSGGPPPGNRNYNMEQREDDLERKKQEREERLWQKERERERRIENR